MAEEPVDDFGVGVGLRPTVVCHSRINGEGGVFGSGGFEGVDHGLTFIGGDDFVGIAMERADGNVFKSFNAGRVTATADGDGGGEEFGFFGES